MGGAVGSFGAGSPGGWGRARPAPGLHALGPGRRSADPGHTNSFGPNPSVAPALRTGSGVSAGAVGSFGAGSERSSAGRARNASRRDSEPCQARRADSSYRSSKAADASSATHARAVATSRSSASIGSRRARSDSSRAIASSQAPSSKACASSRSFCRRGLSGGGGASGGFRASYSIRVGWFRGSIRTSRPYGVPGLRSPLAHRTWIGSRSGSDPRIGVCSSRWRTMLQVMSSQGPFSTSSARAVRQ
jgi:hypothetical protein